MISWKENWRAKKITLESLTDHEDPVLYFTRLTDFMTLAAISNPFTRGVPPPISGSRVNFHEHRSEHSFATYCKYVSRSTASKIFHGTINALQCRLHFEIILRMRDLPVQLSLMPLGPITSTTTQSNIWFPARRKGSFKSEGFGWAGGVIKMKWRKRISG